MNDPIVPPILPPGHRLNPKTLRLVHEPTDGVIDLLTQTIDAEKASRRAAELLAIDRKVDGFKQGMAFGALLGSPIVAAGLIVAGRFFGWLP